jgi:hypothetical protein
MRHGLSLALCAALAACTTTDAGPGASIAYRMPRTDAQIALTATLAHCDATGLALQDANLTLTAVAGARPELWTLDGTVLASGRIKRNLKITTTDDGNRVITGINATQTDKTAAIMGNVVKTFAELAPLPMKAAAPGHALHGAAKPKPPATSLCSRTIDYALARVETIQAGIIALREQLKRQTDPAKAKKLNSALNNLATELAGLQTGILHVETSAFLVLPERPFPEKARPELEKALPAPTIPELDDAPFAKWFDSDTRKARVASLFALSVTAAEEPAGKSKPVMVRDPKTLRACGLSMWVPATVPVQVRVTGTGPAYAGLGDLTAQSRLPVSQWADPVPLCLDAGFGEDRTVNLTFDKYGETTILDWTSEATAATVSGAIAGMAPDAVSAIQTLHPSQDAVEKSEIERLQTRQQLNQLRHCQAVIDNGGYDCSQAAP